MKKNRVMRFASLVLVLTLLSTCAISGTFAKYVTTDSATDTARVAKWGVAITANGTTFADEYDTDNVAVKGTIAKSVITSGSAGDALVAPGTAGSMVAMTLSGTPEVAVEVKYEATVDLGNNWLDKGDSTKFYCPLIITVNNTDLKGTAYTSADDFEAAIKAAIDAYTANYAPKQNLATESIVATPDVSWSWPFSTSTDNDEKDTFLGDRAAQDVANAGTISLTVKTTVTQID